MLFINVRASIDCIYSLYNIGSTKFVLQTNIYTLTYYTFTHTIKTPVAFHGRRAQIFRSRQTQYKKKKKGKKVGIWDSTTTTVYPLDSSPYFILFFSLQL